VVAVLNDLFGIQSRGGCSCAGPYGHRLLGIDIETSHAFQREVARGCEGIKPGWTRVNFNYFISETVFEFILDAVDIVATDGWRLLPAYEFDPMTGNWTHRSGVREPALSLQDMSYEKSSGGRLDTSSESILASYLTDAKRLLHAAPVTGGRISPAAVYSADFEALRWFSLPGESNGSDRDSAGRDQDHSHAGQP
jgi:hypothetical protein